MHSKLHKLFSNLSENEKPKFSAFLPWKLLFPLPCSNLKKYRVFLNRIFTFYFLYQFRTSQVFFPLHPLKSMSLATKIFLSNKTKPCFSQRQN